MELDRRQWYVRWFFWSLGIWDEFRDRGDLWWVESRGTNLCHFIRVTLIWAPLVLLLNALVYAAAFATLTVIPVVYFGSTFYVSLIVAIVAIVGAVWGTKKLLKHHNRREEAVRRSSPAPTAHVAPETAAFAPAAPRVPGFFAVLWMYLVAAKRKICPTINFRQPYGRAL